MSHLFVGCSGIHQHQRNSIVQIEHERLTNPLLRKRLHINNLGRELLLGCRLVLAEEWERQDLPDGIVVRDELPNDQQLHRLEYTTRASYHGETVDSETPTASWWHFVSGQPWNFLRQTRETYSHIRERSGNSRQQVACELCQYLTSGPPLRHATETYASSSPAAFWRACSSNRSLWSKGLFNSVYAFAIS